MNIGITILKIEQITLPQAAKSASVVKCCESCGFVGVAGGCGLGDLRGIQ